MAEYRDLYREFQEARAEIVGISVDPPSKSADLSSSLRLPFPLLSDVDKKVLVEWKGLNTAARGGIAFPSTWVISKDLVVSYRVLERKAKRVDPKPVLRFLRGDLDRANAQDLRTIHLNVQGTKRWVKDLVGNALGKKRR